jgi:hypothetical protein
MIKVAPEDSNLQGRFTAQQNSMALDAQHPQTSHPALLIDYGTCHAYALHVEYPV